MGSAPSEPCGAVQAVVCDTAENLLTRRCGRPAVCFLPPERTSCWQSERGASCWTSDMDGLYLGSERVSAADPVNDTWVKMQRPRQWTLTEDDSSFKMEEGDLLMEKTSGALDENLFAELMPVHHLDGAVKEPQPSHLYSIFCQAHSGDQGAQWNDEEQAQEDLTGLEGLEVSGEFAYESLGTSSSSDSSSCGGTDADLPELVSVSLESNGSSHDGQPVPSHVSPRSCKGTGPSTLHASIMSVRGG